MKKFLGLAGYYLRFIKDFATIAKPSNNLLRKDVPFIWRDAKERAFNTLREILYTPTALSDLSKPFIITTDASDYALEAVLSRGEIGRDLPIAHASKAISGAELNYTLERRLLGLLGGVSQESDKVI